MTTTNESMKTGGCKKKVTPFPQPFGEPLSTDMPNIGTLGARIDWKITVILQIKHRSLLLLTKYRLAPRNSNG